MGVVEVPQQGSVEDGLGKGDLAGRSGRNFGGCGRGLFEDGEPRGFVGHPEAEFDVGYVRRRVADDGPDGQGSCSLDQVGR